MKINLKFFFKGLRILSPFITKRKVTVPAEDAIKILLGSDTDQYLGWDKLECKNLFDHLNSGSVVIKFSNGINIILALNK